MSNLRACWPRHQIHVSTQRVRLLGQGYIVEHFSFISLNSLSFCSFLFPLISFLSSPNLCFAFQCVLPCFVTKIDARRVLLLHDVMVLQFFKTKLISMTRKFQIFNSFFFYSAHHSANKDTARQRVLSLFGNETQSKRVSHLFGDPVHHWWS